MADSLSGLKRLPEDVVEYSIFLSIPSEIEDSEVLNFLQRQKDAILAHLSNRLVKYIWQHEPFNLRPVISTQDSIPSHLHGTSDFGDNIDDEWFIVSLLYEITREFAGSVVRVVDNDEEFLLIEAADVLPKWLDPETAENRVYIYNGDLHVIPIPQTTEDFAKYPLFTPTKSEAVACIRDCASETRCPQPIQDCINKKISCFPRKIKENCHSVNCYLPTPLAAVLSEHPSLVSAGVRSFYYRDPLELKACRPMKRFKPDDLVRTRVRMTRCLYAQLVQQRFFPDKRSGWPLVAPSNPEFLERDIGVKLAHGFEILCSKCLDTTNGHVNGETISDSDIRWQQFKRSLISKGYFRGEIEGSKLYQELVKEAKEFFVSQINHDESGNSDSVAQQVVNYVRELEPKFDDFRRAERHLPPSDDDSWINVTAEQVDEMMKAAGGWTSTSTGETFDLSKVAEGMANFVEHESGIEGAEFPREATSEPAEGDGQFEGSGLIQAMQKMFEFPEDKDSSGSDMSEYDWSDGSIDDLGSPTKMPATVKKSSLKKSKSDKTSGPSKSAQKPKAVRFSPRGNEDSDNSESETIPVKIPNKNHPPKLPPRPPGMTPPARPSNLHPKPTSPTTRPTQPPPPRPSSHPAPPVPARPTHKPAKPLSKPSSVVKPSAPPPPPPPAAAQATPEVKRDKKLEALMEAMDRELAGTEVGKSFERVPKQPKTKKPTRPPPPKGKPSPKPSTKDINDEDDDFCPVNIDLNLVKNTLESYKAQQGLPGPASNILGGLGIQLPQDKVNGDN